MRSSQVSCCLLGLAALVLVFVAAPAWAQCVASTRSTDDLAIYGDIGLTRHGIPTALGDDLQEGASKWNDPSCNPGGTSFPQFLVGASSAGRMIDVVWNDFVNPENSQSCGNFQGTRVNLYSRYKNPADGAIRSCAGDNALPATFAHELGHAIGLVDQFQGCQGFIMSQRTYRSDGSLVGRNVQPEECAIADTTHKTSEELSDEEPLGSDPEPVPNPDCQEEPCTPIVLDLEGHGFQFTDPEDGVEFDIDADGRRERIAWTDRFGDEAFLALDRNGNDTIDDGSELFGAAAPQPATPTPDGFRALRVFDTAALGGNEDGWISVDDTVFPYLILWQDKSHDGIAQPHEMKPLATSGVRAIHLTPVISGRRDWYGNLLRWISLVDFDRNRRLAAADVIFLIEP